MRIGDLVKVKTRFYGTKTGFLIEKVNDVWGDGWMISPTDHPRKIIADPRDIEVISSRVTFV
jgi:hypothetical protein